MDHDGPSTAASTDEASPLPTDTVRFNNKVRLRQDDAQVGALRKCSACAKAYRYQSSLKRHLATGKCRHVADGAAVKAKNGGKTVPAKRRRKQSKAAGGRVDQLKGEAAGDMVDVDESAPRNYAKVRRSVDEDRSALVRRDHDDDDNNDGNNDGNNERDDDDDDGDTMDTVDFAVSPVNGAAPPSTELQQQHRKQWQHQQQQAEGEVAMPMEERHRLDERMERAFAGPTIPVPKRACLSFERLARDFLYGYVGRHLDQPCGGESQLVQTLVEVCRRTATEEPGARAIVALVAKQPIFWRADAYGSAFHVVQIAERMIDSWRWTDGSTFDNEGCGTRDSSFRWSQAVMLMTVAALLLEHRGMDTLDETVVMISYYLSLIDPQIRRAGGWIAFLRMCGNGSNARPDLDGDYDAVAGDALRH